MRYLFGGQLFSHKNIQEGFVDGSEDAHAVMLNGRDEKTKCKTLILFLFFKFVLDMEYQDREAGGRPAGPPTDV